MQQVRNSLRKYGGVVAQRATIERGAPVADAHIIGNNTLVLVNPYLIGMGDPLPSSGFIVLPEEPWVVGQVQVAVVTKQELHLKFNDHALLPAEVEILEIAGNNKFKWVDRGRINYVRIDNSDQN